jgi:repressor LexA
MKKVDYAMEPLTEAQQELYDWLVCYVDEHQHSPSIRQMMRAMNLKSPAPVQSRLEHLRQKGYITWKEGTTRSLRIPPQVATGIPIRGVIAATSLVESFADMECEYLDLSPLFRKSNHFALKVRGHSMIDAGIDDGDIVILKPVLDPKTIKDNTIVAASVGSKTTLKYFRRKGKTVCLIPGNPDREAYPITEVPASQLEIQGVVIGLWRGYEQ